MKLSMNDWLCSKCNIRNLGQIMECPKCKTKKSYEFEYIEYMPFGKKINNIQPENPLFMPTNNNLSDNNLFNSSNNSFGFDNNKSSSNNNSSDNNLFNDTKQHVDINEHNFQSFHNYFKYP